MPIQTPLLATDGIIRVFNTEHECLGIVLIERLNPPHGLALPGGFVDLGESVENALKREMLEETSLEVKNLQLLNVYSEPSRDVRFHAASVVYVCDAYGTPKAQDDAKSLEIYPLDHIPFEKLVFDHSRILKHFLALEKM